MEDVGRRRVVHDDHFVKVSSKAAEVLDIVAAVEDT